MCRWISLTLLVLLTFVSTAISRSPAAAQIIGFACPDAVVNLYNAEQGAQRRAIAFDESVGLCSGATDTLSTTTTNDRWALGNNGAGTF